MSNQPKSNTWDKTWKKISKPRIDLTSLTIFSEMDRHINFKNKSVLELGCGSGRLSFLIAAKGAKSIDLVDFSEKMLKLAKEKARKLKIPAEFILADISKKLPFEKNFFQCALSVSALHCLPPKSHKKAIAELYRVLKPKGKALIGVWNFHSKRFNQKKGREKLIGWTNKGKRYYYLFEEKEIHDLFKKAGFKILSTHNSEMMINFIVEK